MEETETLADVLQAYIRRIPMSDTQFAGLIPMNPQEFSRRKNGHKDFEIANARKVLEILAQRGAITNMTQARNLLQLMKIPDLPDGDWNNEPLKRLKDAEHDQPDKTQQQPTPAGPITPLALQASGEIGPVPSLQASPIPPQRPKGIVARHIWVIVGSVILIAVLAAGSVFMLWGPFHKAQPLKIVPLPLQNASFEDWKNGLPSQWQCDTRLGWIRQVPGREAVGSKALEIGGNPNNQNYVYCETRESQEIPVIPGSRISLSFWARQIKEGTNPKRAKYVDVVYYNGSAWVWVFAREVTDSDKWTHYETDWWDVPTNAQKIAVDVILRTSGAFQVDDIELRVE